MPIACNKPLAMLLLPAWGLSACQTLAPAPPDRQIMELAQSLESEASSFFATLVTARAPDCDFAHNAAAYAELAAIAGQLQEQLAATPSGKPLRRAADALYRSIAQARSSHEKASAVVTDPAGPCLASGAIALNANAITRASRAIVASQVDQGAR